MQFEDLDAWQQARKLVGAIYSLSRSTDLGKDFGLRGQIQHSAVSVMTNIAEGFERTHQAEKRQFYNVARASCGETRSLLYVALDAGYISPDSFTTTKSLSIRVGQLLSGLIRSLDRNP